MSGRTGAPGASVECLYRDPESASFSFAALSDHPETLLPDILGLIATFIWFKAALGEAGRKICRRSLGGPDNRL